jgi:hypothetical protein
MSVGDYPIYGLAELRAAIILECGYQMDSLKLDDTREQWFKSHVYGLTTFDYNTNRQIVWNHRMCHVNIDDGCTEVGSWDYV